MDVNVAEAKNRLPELIRLMENGEIVITRHGKPVAQIIGPHRNGAWSTTEP
jgi:prevent-host-death family protein